MEEKIFPLPAVSRELREHFIEARLHTDGGPRLDANKKLQEDQTGSLANPFYVVIDPKTGRRVIRKGGYMPEAKFLDFLKHGGQD